MPDRHDRFVGTLLGLAVGDAVGTTLEFQPPGTFEPITDMVGGGPFRLNPGEWTDDTSMALCLAESLIEKRGFDPRDQMERYNLWEATGYLSSNGFCFDIGNTVLASLSRYRLDGNPFAGAVDPRTAGNGSIMRLAPIPMFYAMNGELAIRYSGDSSRTTHGALTCVDACRYLGGLLWAAINGTPKEDILSSKFSPLGDRWIHEPLCSEISKIAAGSFKEKRPPGIQGTGYVVSSLEAALWAFYETDDFRTGCLLAANLGDDADTTAAVYGQLAGAYYGKSGIPREWLERLADREKIENFGKALLAFGS